MTDRNLTDKDVDELAEKLVHKVHELKHDFWIDPEEHYKSHARMNSLNEDEFHSLRDLVIAYRSARSLFWKAFLGFAIVGFIAASAIGFGVKH